MDHFSDKNIFLSTYDHFSLAAFFGLSYKELANIIYNNVDNNYKIYKIPKKSGGFREICAPSHKLKLIQKKLANVLYEIYPGKSSAHGFCINKSILTNASSHLHKKHILNFDLEDFFGSIHFGRVRNLFKSRLFSFDHNISTILAQICCFNNSLPQGAPTSPIISNLITWKLDSEMQHLAGNNRCTYTRYVDDITFSFSCTLAKISKGILLYTNNDLVIGDKVLDIIKKNGFKLNSAKTRFCSNNSRMEVTGLTVNEFVNVKRKFVREIYSILHSWRKFGYINTERKYNELYFEKNKRTKSLIHATKGKISYLKSILGKDSSTFKKLALQYNCLVDKEFRFIIENPINTLKGAIDSLWVVECCYDDDQRGYSIMSQGTAFSLHGVGIVTCAHVVSDSQGAYQNLNVYKYTNFSKTYKLNVKKICNDRDIAICDIDLDHDVRLSSLYRGCESPNIQQEVTLLGFPGFDFGHQYYLSETKISSFYTSHAVKKFEIDTYIREGNSGGPVLDKNFNVIGFALEGVRAGSGKNGCLDINEIDGLLNDS